jgi:maltose O-acetyltransferase
VLNAQLQLREKIEVPLSVRLQGKVRTSGRGEIVLGPGVDLSAVVVPIELIAYEGARLLIGDGTFVNYGTSISAHQLVSIGRQCLLGHYTLILDNNEHDTERHYMLPPSDPVVIGDHVWIGSRSVILPGVRIGHHAVIGAGSIVTKDVPARSVAVGNPARVVRSLDNLSSLSDHKNREIRPNR